MAIFSGFSFSPQLNDENVGGVSNYFENTPSDKFLTSYSPRLSKTVQLIPENETTFTYLSEQYGFSLLFPENKDCFSTFPLISFNILNETKIFSYGCHARVSNSTNRTGTDWFSFYPMDENNQSVLINQVLSFWDSTLETLPIYIEFMHSDSVAQYNYSIFRDVTAPIIVFGYDANEEGDIIPHSGSLPYFAKQITVYFDIIDNRNNTVSLFYTVNNQGFYHDMEIIAGNDTHPVHNIIQIAIPLWEELHEGENLIPFFVNDTAGNPSTVDLIGFIKDSEAPAFDNYGIQHHWLDISDTPLSDYKNPFSNVYEFQEIPVFHFSFEDSDISKITLFFEVPFAYNISELQPFSSGIDNDDLFIPKGDISTRILFNAEKISSTVWEIGIPADIWDDVGLDPVNVEIMVEDYAGNIAEFDFILIRNDNPLFFTYSKWFVLTFTVLILFLGSISASISSKISHLPRIPVEIAEHIDSIDPDLLDLLLHTVDPILAQKFVAYLHSLGEPFDLDYVTPPDLRSFLHTPFQPVDLKEIHTLITTFKMEPLSQEHFLREMLALSPEDRKAFLKKYMEANIDMDYKFDQNKDFEGV